MSTTYQNPPVIYTVAKLNYMEGLGNHGDDKYEALLVALKPMGFESFLKSGVNAYKFQTSENQNFSVSPSNINRVGYFNADRSMCLLLDEKTIELRLSQYTNHSHLLDTFVKSVEICNENQIGTSNTAKEIELHYIDLFYFENGSLEDMFASIKLPSSQFYRDEESDLFEAGAISYTRILKPGNLKLVVNVEWFSNRGRKNLPLIPGQIGEPDSNLEMPVFSDRLFGSKERISEYAIVYSNSSALVQEPKEIRDAFETLYAHSKTSFDNMIDEEVCNDIWLPK
ncbi:hypothetical protein [uncultured Psychrosphaera sp.]|uniref:hypothetical protein n=1 Tax=uncultured Psychrosphaera sp. TaxID=1403522 RepID=UPI002619641C|nr:hypothetical protein [uncultured Psychrosphaera sp.]